MQEIELPEVAITGVQAHHPVLAQDGRQVRIGYEVATSRNLGRQGAVHAPEARQLANDSAMRQAGQGFDVFAGFVLRKGRREASRASRSAPVSLRSNRAPMGRALHGQAGAAGRPCLRSARARARRSDLRRPRDWPRWACSCWSSCRMASSMSVVVRMLRADQAGWLMPSRLAADAIAR